MRWVAPTEKDEANHQLEKRLWDAADQFRANSGLKAGEYSGPVLGLIFLRFAEARFAQRRAQLEKAGTSARRGTSRIDDPKAYQAEGVLFLTPSSRFDYLLQRPEGSNVGKAVNEAMADIEKHNPQLAGVLPRNYQIFNGTLLKELLKKVSEIPVSLDYDAFGRIYEYFLGQFARTEGQKGGEFYTPAPIVRLMVEILERMVRLNRTRADYLEKFEALIEAYNSGSRNIEEIFKDLVALSRVLTEEQDRHVREHLSEEELTVFDILTRPGPKLSTEERDEVKKVARQLLERLNALLVLGWRQKIQARAKVRIEIEDTLDKLPRAYGKELYEAKCSTLFEYVYEAYQGDGASAFIEANGA